METNFAKCETDTADSKISRDVLVAGGYGCVVLQTFRSQKLELIYTVKENLLAERFSNL